MTPPQETSMGEGKHTAGPLDWEAVGVDGQAHIYLTDSTGRKIASLWGRPDEKIANAHLFKAAPDLLKAAQWARTCVPYPSDCHTALSAAIARATGQDTGGE